MKLGLVDKEDGKNLMLRLEKNYLNCMKHSQTYNSKSNALNMKVL